MKSFKYLASVCLLCLLGVMAAPAYSAEADIYLVYVGTDKMIQKAIKKSLPGGLKVKSYNASLLSMADFSEKQKAVIKLSKAKLVVLITRKPYGLLGEPKFANVVAVEGGGKPDIDKIMSVMNGLR